MMFTEPKINFSEIKDRVGAAELLQSAGCDYSCREVLRELAAEISKKLAGDA